MNTVLLVNATIGFSENLFLVYSSNLFIKKIFMAIDKESIWQHIYIDMFLINILEGVAILNMKLS